MSVSESRGCLVRECRKIRKVSLLQQMDASDPAKMKA